MYIIGQITDDFMQKQTLILPDGTSLQMSLYYIPLQNGWFITNLTYGTFTLTNIRITVAPNFLRQFKNQIPFGMACYANNVSREPMFQEDFESGAFSLYLLDAAEVTQYEDILSGNVSG
jgi:hypothetical protein